MWVKSLPKRSVRKAMKKGFVVIIVMCILCLSCCTGDRHRVRRKVAFSKNSKLFVSGFNIISSITLVYLKFRSFTPSWLSVQAKWQGKFSSVGHHLRCGLRGESELWSSRKYTEEAQILQEGHSCRTGRCPCWVRTSFGGEAHFSDVIAFQVRSCRHFLHRKAFVRNRQSNKGFQTVRVLLWDW